MQQQPQNYYMHSENNFHNSQPYSMGEHKTTNYHQHHHGGDIIDRPNSSSAGQDQDIAHIVDQVLSCIDQFNVEQPQTQNSVVSNSQHMER